jgi:glycosyltransferase involved in cell wall biosynthesis
MKIWVINHYAGNLDYGMEYRHYFLCKYLKQLGIEPIIICSSYHHLYTNPPKINRDIEFEYHDDLPFAIVKTNEYKGNGLGRLWNTLQFSLRLNRLEHHICEKFGAPDVVLGSTPHPFVALNLYRIKRRYGIPSIFEVRDIWPLMLFELGSLSKWHPLAKIFSYLERLAFRDNEKLISLWHSADKYMVQQGVPKEKYVYLPNGIELDGERQSVPPAEQDLIDFVRQRKSEGKFLIGYGGSHGLANPLDMMIEACACLEKKGNKNVEFILVGDGPEKQRIVKRANELKLKNIHFFDYVSKQTIMEFYDHIDVAFMGLKNLPLFKYGPTPNKLMDYLAAGKPIIYSIDSSFNPVEESGAGLTVKSEDAEGLAKAALELSHLESFQLQSMGRSGRIFAEKQLSYFSLARQLHDVLRKL